MNVKDKLWTEPNDDEIPESTDGRNEPGFGSLEALERLVEQHREFFPEKYFNELQGDGNAPRRRVRR